MLSIKAAGIEKINEKRKIEHTDRFLKQFYKFPQKIQKQADRRITHFAQSKLPPKYLKDHALQGKYKGYRSISITGDVRALYYQRDDGTIVVFAFIGTHSQLYG